LSDAEKENATKFVIYYVGHGHAEFGGWVCHVPDKGAAITDKNEKLVHIHDILELIKKSSYEESVEITSESCHSGFICHLAKEWMERDENREDCGFKHLFIMASTYYKNRGVWGAYRKFKGAHGKAHITKEE